MLYYNWRTTGWNDWLLTILRLNTWDVFMLRYAFGAGENRNALFRFRIWDFIAVLVQQISLWQVLIKCFYWCKYSPCGMTRTRYRRERFVDLRKCLVPLTYRLKIFLGLQVFPWETFTHPFIAASSSPSSSSPPETIDNHFPPVSSVDS